MNSVVFSAARRVTVRLYTDIGEGPGQCSASSFAQSLSSVGPADTIELRVNSRGGDAFVGLAIASILRDHPAKKIGVVDGLAASAASLPLMVCDTVCIPANALLMIHDPLCFAIGRAAELDRAKAMLAETKAAAVSLYVAKTGKSAAEVSALMSAETWLSGTRAVEMRFADTTLPPVQNAPDIGDAKLAFAKAAQMWMATDSATTAEPFCVGSDDFLAPPTQYI